MERDALAGREITLLLVRLAEKTPLVLARRRQAHAHRVLVLRAGDPARGVGKLVRTVADVDAAALGVHLFYERPAGLVGLVEIAVDDLGLVGFALSADNGLRLVVLVENGEPFVGGVGPGLVVAFRDFVVDDRILRERRLDDLRAVHRAVVHMAEIVVFERDVLVVRDRRFDLDGLRPFAQNDARAERVIAREAEIVHVRAADGDELALLVLAEFKVCLAVARDGKFGVADVGVLRRGVAHRGKAAVHHEAAIGFGERDLAVLGFVVHRLHRQLAAVEIAAPDHLPHPRQNRERTLAVGDLERFDAGGVAEGLGGELAVLGKQRRLGSENEIGKVDFHFLLRWVLFVFRIISQFRTSADHDTLSVPEELRARALRKILKGAPSSPKRARMFFSRNDRYAGVTSFGSFTKSRIVCGFVETCSP